MSDLPPLAEIDITGVEEHPIDESVKLRGPPGTGKTTNAAARLARNIKEHDVDVRDVTWATYRKSLAKETRRKLRDWGILSHRDLDEPREGRTQFLGTMNAVANRSVGSIGPIADGGDRRDFCDHLGVTYRASSRKPWERASGELAFEVIDWLAKNLMSVEHAHRAPAFDDLRDEWPGCDLVRFSRQWEDYKDARELRDFHEQLEAALTSNTTPPTDVVVIDEYHDAYPLFAAVARKWVEAADVAIVAGDPDQVVNAYRGADPVFFEDVDLPEVKLDRSYRVGATHGAAAHTLLANAHNPPDVAHPAKGATIHEVQSPRFRFDEGAWSWNTPSPSTVGSPTHLVDETDADHAGDGSLLFLTRTRRQAGAVAAALLADGVLFYGQPGFGGWQANGHRLNLYNALTKLSALGRPAFADGPGLENYQSGNADDHPDPEDVVFATAEVAAILSHTQDTHLADGGEGIGSTIAAIRQSSTPLSAADLAEHVRETFWDRYTQGAGSVGALVRSHPLDADGLTALRNALQRTARPTRPEDLTVGVLTIHASKGQEAEAVALYDGVTSRIRDQMRESRRHRENEYRTWYVALTRASQSLYILRDGFDWTSPMLPSNVVALAADATSAPGEPAVTDGGASR